MCAHDGTDNQVLQMPVKVSMSNFYDCTAVDNSCGVTRATTKSHCCLMMQAFFQYNMTLVQPPQIPGGILVH